MTEPNCGTPGLSPLIGSGSIPHFEWSGHPREIGRQHGESQRENIAELVEYMLASCQRRWTFDGVVAPDIDEHLAKLLGCSSSYDADLSAEMFGIAEGANQDPIRIAAVNAFLDLINLRPIAAEDHAGCTLFAAAGSATRDGGIYIAQNYDVWEPFRKSLCLMTVRPRGHPQHL